MTSSAVSRKQQNPGVSFNPNFSIEKEGKSSVTLIVIGILLIAGGATCGILGLKEVLHMGKTGSYASLIGGPVLGVSFVVSGIFMKALSNRMHGLGSATETNKVHRLAINSMRTGIAHSKGGYGKESSSTVHFKGPMQNVVIGTFTVTQHNKVLGEVEKTLDRCDRNSIHTQMRCNGEIAADGSGEITITLSTPIANRL